MSPFARWLGAAVRSPGLHSLSENRFSTEMRR